MPTSSPADSVARYADMFTALGGESRLRVMRLLLASHPGGLVVGDIQKELEISPSTLSHHLERLKNERLVTVKRESSFLRYTANTVALQELLTFLIAECCARNHAVCPNVVLDLCRNC